MIDGIIIGTVCFMFGTQFGIFIAALINMGKEKHRMGLTVDISTLEEMCDLMCDNILPEPRATEQEAWWYFTFGIGQPHAGRYVKIRGTYDGAREKMHELYGKRWAFQYSEKKWKEMENDPDRYWPMETELTTVG